MIQAKLDIEATSLLGVVNKTGKPIDNSNCIYAQENHSLLEV